MFKTNIDSTKILAQLQNAIYNNTPPSRLLYNFLSSGSMEGNFLANKMQENKAIMRLITSPAGRRWIKANLDDFLNYMEKMSR
jgi:hypothetical protein